MQMLRLQKIAHDILISCVRCDRNLLRTGPAVIETSSPDPAGPDKPQMILKVAWYRDLNDFVSKVIGCFQSSVKSLKLTCGESLSPKKPTAFAKDSVLQAVYEQVAKDNRRTR